MKTKSKYSPFERYYFIHDTKNNLYWEKNIHYGFNFQNQEVFEARFVDKLEDAMGLTWEEAGEVMASFLTQDHIFGGRFKAEDGSLYIERFPELISEEDAKLLQGTPAPLQITIPITIDEEDDVGND